MILTLARGHYCPKEHQQHLELAALQPKLAVAYTNIVTIATDDHHPIQEFRASVGAQWPFLSDPGRIVQKDLSIPGLREAWEAGDVSRFHGWETRSQEEVRQAREVGAATAQRIPA